MRYKFCGLHMQFAYSKTDTDCNTTGIHLKPLYVNECLSVCTWFPSDSDLLATEDMK